MVQKRSANVPWNHIPGKLPQAVVPENVDLHVLSHNTLTKLPQLRPDDLAPQAVWRDYLSFSGSLRTYNSAVGVLDAWTAYSENVEPHEFKLTPDSQKVVRLGGGTISWVDIGFTCKTRQPLQGNIAGYASLIPDGASGDKWRIWMLRTWLENFEGHGHPDNLDAQNPDGSAFESTNNRQPEVKDVSHFGAIVIGAGQAGLGVAGRLKALGVPYLLIERNSQVGDNWSNRYDSVRWHTSKEYGHLPFDRTYLPEDDYMLTGKMIGSGFKRWTERFDINMRLGTTVEHASYDRPAGLWTLTVKTDTGTDIVTCHNLVLAIGGYAGDPISPSWPGREKYTGTAIHSSTYKSAHAWQGSRGIVIGTANTAHDVAEDMVSSSFSSITMVQRSPTFVFPAEWLHKAEDIYYNTTIPTAVADRINYTYPNKITREITNLHVHKAIDANSARFDALEAAGFRLERKGDIYDNLYSRFGGHYVDIGTSARIASGEIKMKFGLVKEWTEKGLKFEDGSEIEAELVVFCTGFDKDFRKMATRVVGDAAEEMDEFFGVDAEGEIRGAWKLAGRECCMK